MTCAPRSAGTCAPAAWAQSRDIRAARISWERARTVADRLPTDDPGRASMRIAPRTLLCMNTVRVAGSIADTGFDELRDLCSAAGDTVSLAIGMAGLTTTLVFHNRYRDAARVASDCSRLLESIPDPGLTLAISTLASNAMWQAGQAAESLSLAQRVIDLAEGDPTKGSLGPFGSPLAMAILMRGCCRYCLGIPGWREDLDQAIAMARSVDLTSFIVPVLYKYRFAVHAGVLLPDAAADQVTTETMEMAEHSGDDFAVDGARVSRGLVLINQGGSQRAAGFALLAQYREAHLRHGYAETRSADCRHRDREGESQHRRYRRRRPVGTRGRRLHFRRGRHDLGWRGHQGLGGITAAARHERRPQRGAGRDRPAGSGADRPRIRTVRGSAAAAAGSSGAVSRRCTLLTHCSGIVTARWRKRLASKGISPWPTAMP